MNVISPRAHGVIDYATVGLAALAPTLFGFSGVAEALSRTVAGAYLFITLCTAFPLGVAKLIPFRVHGLIEAVTGVALLAAPWLFRFADQPAARNFFLFLGATALVVFALTNWRGTEYEAGRGAFAG